VANLVVGAKATSYPGWQSTDLRAEGARLDVRRAGDWSQNFAPDSVDRIVCEHVLEHMTVEDAQAALCHARRHLKPGGHVRVAVPDAFNPDPAYREHCRPGGRGQAWARLLFYAEDEPEHKVFYNYQTLSQLMKWAGLEPRLLEWFDERGQFHRNPWSLADGPVRRYYNSPYNLQVYVPFHGFQNVSLIVDGVKPADTKATPAGDRYEVSLDARAAVADAPVGPDSTGRLVLLGAAALAAGFYFWGRS
jgi:predicted SAM-dependent methyltransferase